MKGWGLSMEKYTLVIEVDFNEIKAILKDENGEGKATSKKEITKFHSEQGWIEVDANEIWITTMYVIMNLMKNFSINPENICEIGIKSTEETLVIWERTTGLPIYHAVFETPQCTFGKTADWILEHAKGLKENTEKERIIFGTVDLWIAYRLTGEGVLKSEPMMDNEKNKVYGCTDPIHFLGMEIPVVKV